MLPWHEVFRLQLFPGAGHEPHAKVRQALKPRTGNAHLLGAVFRRQCRNRVQVDGSELRPIKLGARVKFLPFFDAVLDPQFVDALFLPVGEQADAVSAGFDGIKVFFQLAEGKVLIHILPHHKTGLNVESDFRDYSQSAQSHH